MQKLQVREIGTIKEIKKSVAKVTGLYRCMSGQLLDITDNAKGLVIGFSRGVVSIFLLGRIEEVRVGDTVYSKMESLKVPVGKQFLGRIVNALAEPIDGKGSVERQITTRLDEQPVLGQIPKNKTRNEEGLFYSVFRQAPGVLERVPIKESFETGTLVIDAAIPIGKGQRELIIGDRMTGKTTICVDAILNQKDKNVICIYCCIGRSYSLLQRVVETLKVGGALEYTIVVSATAGVSSGEQYLSPYTACALGEYFMDRGRDVFVVFDDLSKHAWAYRQLSLLLERPPGRDAYPGDIFYLHSQLMERAAKYSPEFGSGSMTFFPVVDTLQGDLTGFVPSNLVSMTDGQIYLNTNLFNSGFKPAVDLGLSVSRIGSKVQCSAMKDLSAMLRLEYVRYKDLLKVTQFKSNVSDDVNKRVQRGEVLTQLFIQLHNKPYSLVKKVFLLYAFQRNILEAFSSEEFNYFKEHIESFIKEHSPDFLQEFDKVKALTKEIKEKLDKILIAFFKAST